MRKATRTQWIKFSIVTLLYLAFLVWVKSWLGTDCTTLHF